MGAHACLHFLALLPKFTRRVVRPEAFAHSSEVSVVEHHHDVPVRARLSSALACTHSWGKCTRTHYPSQGSSKLSTPVHCRFLLCVKRATTLAYPSPPRLSDCLPANLPDGALCVSSMWTLVTNREISRAQRMQRLLWGAHCKSILACVRACTRPASSELSTR